MNKYASGFTAVTFGLFATGAQGTAVHAAEIKVFAPRAVWTSGELCEDHNGTYLLPFLCQWRDDGWHDAKTGRLIEATVVGWRRP
jgi:hypothetical protein